MSARLIIITGQTGAGKTSYADRLQANKTGHAFCIDRWMTSLFWQDMPAEPDMAWFKHNHEWYVDKIARCEARIQDELTPLLKLGVNCILDLGFTASSHRMKYVQLALDNACRPEIHFLDYNTRARWLRVETRNKTKDERFSMHVDKAMFDYIENIFEPICEQEEPYLQQISSLDTHNND